ncbi:Electron transport complex protein RnfC [Poriferisphaera corsica]|uniref:Electron transport complex protein RnfC n=2 Tax=Poriferisphaera corsica TaxID=2528020 RepID=A0A517YQ95_9BACT|nr:Electron transport complex protein RnfC [Poriferisphaera corsica]
MPTHFHGGMTFQAGKPYPFPSLPKNIPAHPLRITVTDPPIVTVGQTITASQKLTEPFKPQSPCYFSPIPATVTHITPWQPDDFHRHTHARNPHEINHPTTQLYDIHLKPIPPSPPAASACDQSADENNPLTVPAALNIAPPDKPTLKSWFQHFRALGPWPQDEIGCDLITQLAAVLHNKHYQSKPPKSLICIGMDAYSPYPDRSSLLLSYPDDAVLGLQILGNLLNVKRPKLVIDANPHLEGFLKNPCKSFKIKLLCARNRYPAPDPTLIAHTLENTKLPQNGSPTDVGIVMVTPWTVIRIARWMTRRQLDVLQPVMIAEPHRDKHPQRHFAMPGTEICCVDHTLHGCTERLRGKLIAGNPLTGNQLCAPALVAQQQEHSRRAPDSLPPTIRHGMQLLTNLASTHHLEPAPCITCGWCVDACPTGLQPVHLAEQIHNHQNSKQLQDHLQYCIGCGLCTHVCPSHLPIAQILAQANAPITPQIK